MTVQYSDVVKAAERIANYVHRTPVVTSEKLNGLSGSSLYFKCENLQKAGAFKSRGAMNALLSMDAASLERGVATHSSGNHGAALARAASIRHVPAYIVVPRTSNPVKQQAIQSYGGTVILSEPTLAAREAKLHEVLVETGATLVHPYDQPEIISGQGTAMLELLEQASDLDSVIVPVGGGGLLAGSTLVGRQAGVQLIGAEPHGADDAYRSLMQGERVTHQVPDTICDGLLTTLGVANYEIIKAGVSQILLATDAQVVDAMRLIWTRLKLVVEPSSAVTLAVVLNHPELFRGKRLGLMLTGGNVDLARLPFS